jgi:lactoylglutathione lyase
MKIEHIAIWSGDIERLKQFYASYFGAEAGPKYSNLKTGFESYFLTFSSGARLELMARPDVELVDRSGQEFMGYAHLAIAVGSEAAVDRLTARLQEDGYGCLSGPRHTGDGYYESVVLDPDGNRIEITG